jgi:prepilin-type N-terminal cleavage/methylation domain-containing protein
MKVHESSRRGFTIIELLTVIAVMAILMSLLMTVIGKAKTSAKQSSARNDLLNIVTAVRAYYADYGVYPIAPSVSGTGTEVTFASSNSDLVYTLCAIPQGANAANALNTRQSTYLDVPNVKNPLSPRSGICNGNWYDPWGPQPGKPESGIYHVRIDGSYSGSVTDPYPARYEGDDNGPPPTIQTGVIAWSLAATGVQTYDLQDQVLSWK